MSEADVLRFPRWRQAVQDFLAAGFKDGDLVPHAWLETAFGMAENPPATLDEFKARQFAWLGSVEAFKGELLTDHRVYLQSVFGQGYRVVPPAEQTGAAMERFERDAKRTYRQAAERLKNVRTDDLTIAQRRENLDAIGKLSMIRGMHRAAIE